MSSPWILALAGVGAIAIVRTAYLTIQFLTFHLVKPSQPLKSYKRAGAEPTYALITGASAGIGFGVAQALVKQGFGVILLGHLAGELAEAAATLKTLRSDAAVRTLVVDARTATPAELEAAVQSIAALQVSILVNNVGGNPIELPAFRTLATYSSADVDAVIDMNTRFMARLTALMLPILSRKPGAKERSLILNTSSAGMIGLPWLVMYSATKAFNWGFSRGLSRELEVNPETKHIDCLAIIPGDVRSQGNSEAVADNAPNWDVFGQCIVEKVDGALWRRKRDTMPYLLHDMQNSILAALPEGTRSNALADVMRKKRDAFNAVYKKSR